MAIEVELGRFRGEDEIEKQTEKIQPGGYKRYKFFRPRNDVAVYLSSDNKRGVVEVGGLSNCVFAIKYHGEEDKEGEIADLITTNKIELTQGQEVVIIKDGKKSSQEMWFYLDHSDGEILTATDPAEENPLWMREINQILE